MPAASTARRPPGPGPRAPPPRSSRPRDRARARAPPGRRRRPGRPRAASPPSPPPARRPPRAAARGREQGADRRRSRPAEKTRSDAPELRHPPGRPLAREAQGRTGGAPPRPAAVGSRPPAISRPTTASAAGDALEGLGVVHDEHERVDEQPRELALQRGGRALRVHRLARRDQAVGQNVDGARERAANRLDRPGASSRPASPPASRQRTQAASVPSLKRVAESAVVLPKPASAISSREPVSRAERIRSRRSGRSSTGAAAEAHPWPWNVTIGARAQREQVRVR